MTQVKPLPASLVELKGALAETLARSRLDYNDDVMILTAFLHDFRWKERPAAAANVLAHWRAFLAAPPREHFFNLYLHFPYCREKCLFCFYASRVPPGPRQVADYISQARAEIGLFADIFEGVRFRSFKAGGGTPSLLAEADLRSLFGYALERFGWEEESCRSVECNPVSVDAAKLRLLRKLGFNRVSFGVQSVDGPVLRSVRRGYQSADMVRAAVLGARAAGFEDVNVDLIFGLLGDTRETFLESFRFLAELKPRNITICGLTLTDAYLKVMKTSREAYARHYQAALPEALSGLRELAREHGYQTGELTPERGIWSLVASDAAPLSWQRWAESGDHPDVPSSTLALGDSSRSHVFGRLLYLRQPQPFDSRKAQYLAAPITLKEEMAIYVLYCLENGSRVDYAPFERRFGADARAAFAWELEALERFGQLRRDERGFAFLPTAMAGRIFYGMLFLMDTLAASPFSAGRFDAGLLTRVRRDLAPAS